MCFSCIQEGTTLMDCEHHDLSNSESIKIGHFSVLSTHRDQRERSLLGEKTKLNLSSIDLVMTTRRHLPVLADVELDSGHPKLPLLAHDIQMCMSLLLRNLQCGPHPGPLALAA